MSLLLSIARDHWRRDYDLAPPHLTRGWMFAEFDAVSALQTAAK